MAPISRRNLSICPASPVISMPRSSVPALLRTRRTPLRATAPAPLISMITKEKHAYRVFSFRDHEKTSATASGSHLPDGRRR